MDLIYIGKLVNTHGLKGEVKLISDFKFKTDVFKINNNIYINDIKYTIKSYRKHKMFDMITLDGIDDIEKALELKGSLIYINKEEYTFNGYLNEDLIGLDVYDNDTLKGKVTDIYKTNNSELLVIEGNKKHMVPNIDVFINKVDLENKKIFINYIKGLDNED